MSRLHHLAFYSSLGNVLIAQLSDN